MTFGQDDTIRDEDHLLRLYYEARRSVIFERSGSLEHDIRRLNETVLAYAHRRGLDLPDYMEGV